ncbi:MAG TPA: methyltransferase domain-containing protein [Dehalococcoidia bacterium]|nr:methyltransferase domain-containing protein [Dehalococcoidia bacterium]
MADPSMDVQRIVRETYGAVVPENSNVAEALYDSRDLEYLPMDVRMLALGLGNPLRYAELREGEVVLDLGSGGGIDTFLAGRDVGPSGEAIGLDLTETMINHASRSAEAMGAANVRFEPGAMEDIPLPGESVDVVISNGVINLSDQKQQVFNEAYRVLKPGGRLVFADSVVNGTLPEEILSSEAAWAG